MTDDLRSVMRQFATGVCIATTCRYTRAGARRHNAITVNSLASLSLTPPLVSLSFRADSEFLADALASRVFAVSILGADAEETARTFAGRRPERDRALRAAATRPGEHTGALLFAGAGWMECRYYDRYAVGDHVQVIGEAVALGAAGSEHTPLIFLGGGFHRLDTESAAS
ncbi:flavin reductase family protein [Streptomyces sp. WM6378]|uniref:flavin reductase family protein n=1 Tax=Streptomyces sp. WM6378 TaxID=1415557 RepID=UPI0007C785B9|nr:flavin reductase family protein [Streptomyces sp. WM6378]